MNGLPFMLFGIALGAVVGLTAGLYRINADPKDLPAWLQAAGALIALAVAIFVPMRERFKNRQDAQEVAIMVVATELRRWLDRCSEMVNSTDTHLCSDGRNGQLFDTVPDFPFEPKLEQVAGLGAVHARAAFNIMHRKNEANETIGWTWDNYGSPEHYEAFCTEAAEVYVDAYRLLEKMSSQLGWETGIDINVVEGMVKRVDNAREWRLREEEAYKKMNLQSG